MSEMCLYFSDIKNLENLYICSIYLLINMNRE